MASAPSVLFVGGRMQANSSDRYDVTADGQRFLLRQLTAESLDSANNLITVVVNWLEGVHK